MADRAEISPNDAIAPSAGRRWPSGRLNWPTLVASGVLALVVLGLLFRFMGVSEKLYWHDEVITSLRLAGYGNDDLVSAFPPGSDVAPGDLLALQRRGERTSLAALIRSLAAEDPQHPPLYYVLAYAWTSTFGDSVGAIRSLSVLISLLILPAVAWLCRELFPDRRIAWLAVGLFAVSPVHILYAHEAREYGLWALLIVLSSAALFRASRRTRPSDWGLYALLTAAGLYTYPMHVLVIAAQGASIVLPTPSRDRARLIPFGVSLGVGAAMALPWLWVIWAERELLAASVRHLSRSLPLLDLARGWVSLLPIPFVMLAGDVRLSAIIPKEALYGTHAAVIGLVGVAFVVLCTRTGRAAAVLLTALAGGAFLAMAIPDLFAGGTRSVTMRYLMPVWTVLPVVVAYSATVGMLDPNRPTGERRAWAAGTGLLIGLAIVSDVLVTTTPWAGKAFGGSNGDVAFPIAAQINASPRPLVILEHLDADIPGEAIALSYLLRDHARFRLVSDPRAPLDVAGYSDVFVFRPNQAYRDALERHVTLEEVARYGALFRAHPR